MDEGPGEVLLGMTGGVDSSTAAYYLKRDGHQVVGVTLLFHEGKAQEEKLERAKAAAERLGIEHETLDVHERFGSEIEDWYASEWRAGRESDPVVRYTADFIFPLLLQQADAHGIRRVATGHYAKVTQDEFGIGLLPYQLQRSQEKAKGQTYVLSRLDQQTLARVEFPNAPFPKSWIRRDAMRAGLQRIVQVEDDQDVPVFFDGLSRADWLEQDGGLEAEAGKAVDITSGEAIGVHKGLFRYEIGQDFGDGERFVIAKDVERNTLLVGPKNLSRVESCLLGDVHWTSIEPPKKKRSCRVVYRRGMDPIPCKVVMTEHGLALGFTEAAYGVCPGQTAVLYSDDLVLGCGTVVA